MLDADSFLPDLRKLVYRVCTNRTAADSAAADLILSHSVRLGAQHARTPCVFTQPRIYEISTGDNHEVFTLDCSNYDADEREDDLVQ